MSKGSKPRSGFNQNYRDRYDEIDFKNTRRNKVNKMWGRPMSEDEMMKHLGFKTKKEYEDFRRTGTSPLQEKVYREFRAKPCGECNGSGKRWHSDDSYSQFSYECEKCNGKGKIL